MYHVYNTMLIYMYVYVCLTCLDLLGKMYDRFNEVGLFSSDAVWFPAYYTLNICWNFTDASDKLKQVFFTCLISDYQFRYTYTCGIHLQSYLYWQRAWNHKRQIKIIY